jgi:CRISPR system Cascade subunit CasB
MKSILLQLNSPQEKKNLTAVLARIRNSIGKDDMEASEVWPILFPMLPEDMLGTKSLTCEEKALLTALQLYALGQQGSAKVLQSENCSFAKALYSIRNEETAKAMDRRFNTMLTATTFDEFTYHLRQLFRIAKSKGIAAVNYPALASDLYWYQKGQDKQICLRWAKDYYRPKDGKQELSLQKENHSEDKEALK